MSISTKIFFDSKPYINVYWEIRNNGVLHFEGERLQTDWSDYIDEESPLFESITRWKRFFRKRQVQYVDSSVVLRETVKEKIMTNSWEIIRRYND